MRCVHCALSFWRCHLFTWHHYIFPTKGYKAAHQPRFILFIFIIFVPLITYV